MKLKKKKMAYKIFLCDDIVNFIKGFNMIETKTSSKDTSSKIYFVDSCFKTTDDPNVFEIIGKIDLIESYSINNETKDNK